MKLKQKQYSISQRVDRAVEIHLTEIYTGLYTSWNWIIKIKWKYYKIKIQGIIQIAKGFNAAEWVNP